MITAAASVFIASLVGSLHCAGMCGPFVAVAAGGDARGTWKPQLAYHLGRLCTYLTMGAAAGLAGGLANIAGAMVGIAHVAAIAAGSVMIAYGLMKLLTLIRPSIISSSEADGSAVTVTIGANTKKRVSWRTRLHTAALALHPITRGAVIGLLTTLLPCGWLYVFVAVAAGSANPLVGMLLMSFFWLGTVPILALLGLGADRLLQWRKRFVSVAAALLLVAAGGWTMASRSMLIPEEMAAAVEPDAARVVEDPTETRVPPCCKQ